MLLEYGLRNFFSFKEGAVVSFRFDGNTPETIAQGRPCSTVMGINGANAAGKTHLLKALHFLRFFGAHSFYLKPDAMMPIESYGRSKEPSEFYVEFNNEEITYRYEVAVTEDRVYREALYRTKAKQTQLFERIDNKIIRATKEFEALHSLALRNNASVVSTVNQYQLPILQTVYNFFSSISTNVGYTGLYEPQIDINDAATLLHKVPGLHAFVESFIKSCDTGVSRIAIHQREGEKGEPTFFPSFLHFIDGNEYGLTPYAESSGTKRLFRMLPDYFRVLKHGGVLVVDEFDIHLHPHILPKLLTLFTDVETNPENAQLVFTSHNARLMDNLGRYRTYIAIKRDNESFAFRLDEVPGDLLRNDRPISPAYEEGKLGGVPRV